MTATHEYTSTACQHELCGSCRKTCKFCGTPCQHGCHGTPAASPAKPADVDQARNIARELHALLGTFDPVGEGEIERRILTDPALFWLRGEEQPPGERRSL